MDMSQEQYRGCVAAVGGFDGVHGGHRYLIGTVASIARQRGLDAVAVTFAQHPLKVVGNGFCPALLTTASEKERLLRQCGIDRVVMLDFTREMSLMSAREFMERVLRDELGVEVLVMGYDHRFGHDRDAKFDDYVGWGEELGIEVVRGDEWRGDGETCRFSSSEARRLLLDGDVEGASRILGYDYGVDGVVVGGFRVGRTLGFPTANIEVDSEDKLIPYSGVYAVRLTVLDGEDGGAKYDGMLNIGTRPTLNNGSARSIEVHALDFSGDIYSARVRVEFLKRLRDEHRFESVDELRRQLEMDKVEVRRFFAEK